MGIREQGLGVRCQGLGALKLTCFASDYRHKDNRSMPNSGDRLRVGVVGCGAFGRNHARVYRDLQADPSQGVEFVGIKPA